MSDERVVAANLPIDRRYEHDREHYWAALERFAHLAARSGLLVSADDFMWMSAAEFHDGRVVHSYEHLGTRRCLQLDESGHAYQYRPRAEGGRFRQPAPSHCGHRWVRRSRSREASSPKARWLAGSVRSRSVERSHLLPTANRDSTCD